MDGHQVIKRVASSQFGHLANDSIFKRQRKPEPATALDPVVASKLTTSDAVSLADKIIRSGQVRRGEIDTAAEQTTNETARAIVAAAKKARGL